MNALELFNHRYSEDEKFSWLEMIDFAEAYASQSKEECANYAHCKAVTDGEIEEAVKIAMSGLDDDQTEVPEFYFRMGMDVAIKWMREQQGEGAKEQQYHYHGVHDDSIDYNTPTPQGEIDYIKDKIGLIVDQTRFHDVRLDHILKQKEQLTEKLVNAVIEWMREQHGKGWISVESALPPLAPREDCYKAKPFSVTVYINFGYKAPCKAMYDYTYRQWLDPEFESDLESEFDAKVTHWRVDPPKGLTDKQ